MPPSGLNPPELEDAREYALQLINQARTAAGLNEVILDDNTAAQAHAEDMRANCFLSHWGTDGLKPYMRYTLAGGQQYSAENAHGSIFCPVNPSRYRQSTITERVHQAMVGLMQSPGHRRNILNRHHEKVNLGIAVEHPNFWFVQLFVGDYMEYATAPMILDGLLSLSGRVKNGAKISDTFLGVQIYYDPPPRSLTRGQLHHTTCGNHGAIMASLRRPPGPNAYYSTHGYTQSGTRCNDPYDTPVDVPAASSASDSKVDIKVPYQHEAVWITATNWSTNNDSFAVSADVSNLLAQHGNGVYTILLWGEIDGERTPISEYSIFVPAPNTTRNVSSKPASPASPTVTPTATPTPTITPSPTPTPTPTASEIDIRELEDLTHDLLNLQRVMHGIAPLDHVEKIRLIARSHSEDMATKDYLLHVNLAGLDPTDRGNRAGYECRKDYGSYFTYGLAENIHQGWTFGSYQMVNGKMVNVDWLTLEEMAQSAVDGWMNSPGHRQNILDSSYDRAGMGVAIAEDGKVFFTHNFC